MQWTHSESKMIIRWYSYPATGKFEHMKCVVADNAYGTDAFNREPGKKQKKKAFFFIYFCVIHLMSQWTCYVAIFWRLWELASWPWKKDNLGMKRTPGRYHFSLIFHLLELIYSKFNSPSSAKVNTFSIFLPDLSPSPWLFSFAASGSQRLTRSSVQQAPGNRHRHKDTADGCRGDLCKTTSCSIRGAIRAV